MPRERSSVAWRRNRRAPAAHGTCSRVIGTALVAGPVSGENKNEVDRSRATKTGHLYKPTTQGRLSRANLDGRHHGLRSTAALRLPSMYMGTDWWRWAIFHTPSTLRRQSVLRNHVSDSKPSVRPPVRRMRPWQKATSAPAVTAPRLCRPRHRSNCKNQKAECLRRAPIGASQFRHELRCFGVGQGGVMTGLTLRPVCTENPIRVDDVTESPKLAQ